MMLTTISSMAQSENTLITSDETYTYETVIETISETNINSSATKAGTNTVSGSKTTYCKDGSGHVLWYVKVYGTYTYGNGTAKCTKSSVEAVSKNGNWKITSKSASKSGNKATAKATAKRYQAGIVKETQTKIVTLTCSTTGKLS